jgi:hypothetical protein
MAQAPVVTSTQQERPMSEQLQQVEMVLHFNSLEDAQAYKDDKNTKHLLINPPTGKYIFSIFVGEIGEALCSQNMLVKPIIILSVSCKLIRGFIL